MIHHIEICHGNLVKIFIVIAIIKLMICEMESNKSFKFTGLCGSSFDDLSVKKQRSLNYFIWIYGRILMILIISEDLK